MKFRVTTLAASAAIALGLSVASQANDFDETLVQANPESARSVVIRYHAEALQTEEGRARIERQLKLAAKEVCGPQNMRDAGSLRNLMHNQACFEEALAAAHSQLGEAQVATR